MKNLIEYVKAFLRIFKKNTGLTIANVWKFLKEMKKTFKEIKKNKKK